MSTAPFRVVRQGAIGRRDEILDLGAACIRFKIAGAAALLDYVSAQDELRGFEGLLYSRLLLSGSEIGYQCDCQYFAQGDGEEDSSGIVRRRYVNYRFCCTRVFDAAFLNSLLTRFLMAGMLSGRH